MRWCIVLLAALVAGCMAPGPPAAPEHAAVASACDGDRGIGGTGVRPALSSDDRGIGGTGIVGTVTGLGSICVNGMVIALDSSAAVEVDGVPATQAALRVGQVVSIAAEADPSAMLRARRVAVRHVVSGPVERVAEGRFIRVAGQVVVVPAGFAELARPGAFLAVSGLRRADGVVVATRLDARSAGPVQVSGVVEWRGRQAWLGNARLRAAQPLPTGGVATLRGGYADGVLTVERAMAEPTLPFGAPARRLVVQAFVSGERDGLRLGQGLWVRRAKSLPAPMLIGMAAVVDVAVDASGGMVAVGMQPDRVGEGAGSSAAATGGPAPGGMAPGAAPAPGGATAGRGMAGGNVAGASGRGGSDPGTAGQSGGGRQGGDTGLGPGIGSIGVGIGRRP